MSGGSFDYLMSRDASEIMQDDHNLVEMIKWLDEQHKTILAQRLRIFQLKLSEIRKEIDEEKQELYDLMYAAEWWASGDWGKEHFEKETAKYYN